MKTNLNEDVLKSNENEIQAMKDVINNNNTPNPLINFDVYKEQTKFIKSEFTELRDFIKSSLSDGNFNFNLVLSFLKSTKGKNYIDSINKNETDVKNKVQLNNFNYNSFKKSSFNVTLSDKFFSYVQIARITDKNKTSFFCDKNEVEICESLNIDKSLKFNFNIPIFEKSNKIDNFNFAENGVFKGYFVRPFVKNGEVQKDKDGIEIIHGIKFMFEQKTALNIVSEMNRYILANRELKRKERNNAQITTETKNETETKK